MEIRPKHRDVLVAAGFFAIGMVVYQLGLDLILSPDDVPTPAWVRPTMLAVACCGLAFRRSAPVLALLVVTAVGAVDLPLGLSFPVTVVFIDTLYVASLHGSRRLHRAIVTSAALLTLGVTTAAGVVADNWQISLLAATQVFSLVVVPVWWATNVRRHREGAEQVARIAELDRRAAVDAERARIARDLHDVIAGHLSAIAIQSEAVLSMPDGDPETVRTVLKSVRENSLRSLTEMRAMIDVLRADDPVDEPVAVRLADVARLVDSATAAGLRVDLVADDVDGLPVAVDVAAYRIVQEALTNAVKHATGAKVSVRLERQVRRLVVVVRNDVRHGGGGEGSGTGLVSMAERAHTVGGTFAAGREDDGWHVRAELPL